MLRWQLFGIKFAIHPSFWLMNALWAYILYRPLMGHVEDARALKPGILHLVDRVLRVYTPIVLLIAAIAVVGWLIGSWLGTGHRISGRIRCWML